jgi:hypothetical protein
MWYLSFGLAFAIGVILFSFIEWVRAELDAFEFMIAAGVAVASIVLWPLIMVLCIGTAIRDGWKARH